MQPEAKAWTTYLYKLIDSAPTLDSHIACEKALGFLEINYPTFFTMPASSQPHQHHHTVCGLAQHTAEVIQIGLQTRAVLNLQDEISFDEYFIAALYHDSGKLRAYEQMPNGVWVKTVDSRRLHHIYLGTKVFDEMMAKEKLAYANGGDDIVHAILAHHGCREWGSPVAPATPLAQLLHQSDTMSARMNDIVRGVTPLEYNKYKAGEKS
jgi:3'-5' exoribonuclease